MILQGFVAVLEDEGFKAQVKQIDFTEVVEIYDSKSRETFIYSLNKSTGNIELYSKRFPEFLYTNVDNIR